MNDTMNDLEGVIRSTKERIARAEDARAWRAVRVLLRILALLQGREGLNANANR